MRVYQRIADWTDLPKQPPILARETYELDYKSEHTSDASEHAKDIASFANGLGGVILIGVAEKADNFSRKAMPLIDARAVARAYEDAARDLLSPRPRVDPIVVPLPEDGGRALVAVNVDPFPGQLVAARLANTDAWRFPVRVAARHTTYLNPEEAMIHSIPKVRKAAILLMSIPETERAGVSVQLMERTEGNDSPSNTEEVFGAKLEAVDVTNNVVHFVVKLTHEMSISVFAPLEDVAAVWKSVHKWTVRLDGSVRHKFWGKGSRSTGYMSGRGPYNWE